MKKKKIKELTDGSQPSTEGNKTVAEPSTINKEPITTMEVHHHPNLEKKNFKEYFLEFIMIFLAVTMGFFAEQFRESIVDKEKEKHYMENLVGDLRADTAALNRAINYDRVLERMLDSALAIAPERLTDVNVQDTFFHYVFLYYSFIPTFTASTNTISQLKAGGFNILQSDKTKDLINSLYNYYDNNVNFDTKYTELGFLDVAHKMQSMMRLPKSASSWTDPVAYTIPLDRRIFLTTDPVAIAQLYNLLGNASGSLEGAIREQMDALTQASALINYLKQDYNIE